MLFIKKEIDKLHSALIKATEEGNTALYDRLYAAKSALHWALEPELAKSPYYYILDLPTPEHEKAPLSDIQIAV
jgi:hypothetical protein